jgi:hypothetical protein
MEMPDAGSTDFIALGTALADVVVIRHTAGTFAYLNNVGGYTDFPDPQPAWVGFAACAFVIHSNTSWSFECDGDTYGPYVHDGMGNNTLSQLTAYAIVTNFDLKNMLAFAGPNLDSIKRIVTSQTWHPTHGETPELVEIELGTPGDERSIDEIILDTIKRQRSEIGE